MLNLVLHIVFSSGFSVGNKGALRRSVDLLIVGAVNYLAAAVFGAVWFLRQEGVSYGWAGFVYGGLTGACYFIAFFFLIYAMRHQGIAATSAVGQLSVLVPILFSIFLWKESPTFLQSAGIAIAVLSLLLLDARKDVSFQVSRTLRWVLAGFFAFAGASRLLAKAFSESGVPAEKPFYVLSLFLVAGAASVVLLLTRKRAPTFEEFCWGCGVGACNMLQMAFFLMALEQLPGIVVFPISGTGGLVLIGLVAVLFQGERPTGRLYVGFAASTVSIFLLNWKTR